MIEKEPSSNNSSDYDEVIAISEKQLPYTGKACVMEGFEGRTFLCLNSPSRFGWWGFNPNQCIKCWKGNEVIIEFGRKED